MHVSQGAGEQVVSDVWNFSATRKELEAHFENDMPSDQIVSLLWRNTAVLPEQRKGLQTVVDRMKAEYTDKPLANGGVVDKFGRAIRQIIMLSNDEFLRQVAEAEAEVTPESEVTPTASQDAAYFEGKYADEIDTLLGKMERQDKAKARVVHNTNGDKGTVVKTKDLARTLHARARDLAEDPDTKRVVERIIKGLN